jgi:hypothetical protein
MKTRSLRILLAGVALAAPGLLQTPAHAADVANVVGTGAILPGVPTTGCVEGASVSFDGTGVIVGAGGLNPGPYSVSFRGNSTTCETILAGQGTGVLSGGVSGTVNYTRTVGAISLSGTVTVSGQTRSLSATCHVVVTSANPFTTFALDCVVTL